MANGYVKLLTLGVVIVLVLLAASYGADYLLNSASQATTTVTAYYVPNAMPNLGNPGGCTFWQSIPWTTVPLVPTVPVPGGAAGHTHFVYVKAAWTYINGTPYIFILMKARNHGYVSWLACSERTPCGKLWEPFAQTRVGWWVVNVSYTANQSTAKVSYVPECKQLQYPPGCTLSNPIQIIVLNESGKLVGEVLGATLPDGCPLNNGMPVIITSLYLNYSGTIITSFNQFLAMGLNDTTWAQMAYNEFYPEDTAGYVSLFYNSTYTYPERFAILWSLGGVPSDWYKVAYTPHMMPGTSGAISAGCDELWILNNNPRANNTQDTGYPGNTLFSRTSPPPYGHYPQYKDPLNLGYLTDQGIIADAFVNGSSIYYIGGVPFIGFPYLNNPNYNAWDLMNGLYNASQLWDPSVVATGLKLVHSPTGICWCAEFVRTFTTFGVSGGQGMSHYQVQLYPGHTYHVAFAVFQGGAGESVDFKSISFWYDLYIQPAQSSSMIPMIITANGFLAPIVFAIIFGGKATIFKEIEKMEKSLERVKYPLIKIMGVKNGHQ